ncbi:MAG: NADPH-dependent glutamate synthase [Endomicrobiales bacterium]
MLMQPSRITMRASAPRERSRDFQEVNLGYSREEARQEAARCLQCKARPCVEGCPVGVDIPEFIRAIADGRLDEAICVLKEKNRLPAVCGRVCPQEEQCEKRCVLGKKGAPVAIGYLERYAADREKAERDAPAVAGPADPSQARVAVVGSGPAGLTCAGELARMGFRVTVFESLHEPGGVLRYGIPEFRLPKAILDYELENLRATGIRILTNVLVGRTKSVDDLFSEGYEAIFLGVGAGLPRFMKIPGENLNNICSANEFLVRVNLMNGYRFPEHDTPVPEGKKVAVIGGGNTAMDSARTALRLGAEEVTLIYRRSRGEMPARAEEAHHAEEEGIRFAFLTDPVAYAGDERGFVKEITCRKMELGEPDASGRRRPVPVPGSRFTMPVDMAVVAIGLSPNPLVPGLTRGLETHPWGELKINDEFMTTRSGVFAGGDIVGGETVIQAMGMGKKAAQSIKNYLFEKRIEC